MAKWKAGYLVTIDKKTYRVTRKENIGSRGICEFCAFGNKSVKIIPCSKCVVEELMPEDCVLVRVYTARDFSKPLELSDEELREIENLEFLKT